MNIAIVGGDARNKYLAEELTKEGIPVVTYALGNDEFSQKELSHYDVVVGPIPFSRDGQFLYTPFSPQHIAIPQFLSSMKDSAVLFSSSINYPKMDNYVVVDITKDEALYRDSVVATCEGILQILLNTVPFTIHGAKILVLGYGKVGTAVSELLKNVGALVYVYTANDKERQKAEQLYTIGDRSDFSTYDVMVNTIPVVVLTEENIPTIRHGVPVIDVASFPGGVDTECAHRYNVQLIPAPGLPGKKAPRTVAKLMKQFLLQYLKANGYLSEGA